MTYIFTALCVARNGARNATQRYIWTECNAEVVLLVSAWEVDSFGLHGTTPNDFNIDAIRIELGTRKRRGFQHRCISMKSKQLGPENVGPGLDVAWKVNFVGIVIISSYLISPFA
jgi:hypothetical protein